MMEKQEQSQRNLTWTLLNQIANVTRKQRETFSRKALAVQEVLADEATNNLQIRQN